MSFILVIVPLPGQDNHAQKQAWAVFHTFGKVDALKELAGVFYIDDTAWIFDTRKTLREFALVTHQATAQGVPLHAFQLGSETAQSHLGSFPQSETLAKFLAS